MLALRTENIKKTGNWETYLESKGKPLEHLGNLRKTKENRRKTGGGTPPLLFSLGFLWFSEVFILIILVFILVGGQHCSVVSKKNPRHVPEMFRKCPGNVPEISPKIPHTIPGKVAGARQVSLGVVPKTLRKLLCPQKYKKNERCKPKKSQLRFISRNVIGIAI